MNGWPNDQMPWKSKKPTAEVSAIRFVSRTRIRPVVMTKPHEGHGRQERKKAPWPKTKTSAQFGQVSLTPSVATPLFAPATGRMSNHTANATRYKSNFTQFRPMVGTVIT